MSNVPARYSSQGWDVLDGSRIIATCSTAPDRETATSVAARIAALMNGETPPDPVYPPTARPIPSE